MVNKRVVILGGSSGIGRACGKRFAAEGWQVLITGIESEDLDSVIEEFDGNSHLSACLDARNQGDILNLVKMIESKFGEIDVLVNSIGISQNLSALDSDFVAWDNLLQIMLYGPVKLSRSLVPLINDGGRIINITSIHHERVARGSSAYGMAKAAVTQFTRSLAVELAPRGVLVNAVAPGFVDTPMSVKGDGRNELDSDWFHENYVKNEHLPLKRAAKPDEIAGVVFFLAGPDSTYITGSVLTVDGGLTITF